MRFVIADDSLRQRDVLERILINDGHEIVGAELDGREAIEACKSKKPDVALFDIAMMRMNGDIAAYQVRKLMPKIQVIVVSNNTQLLITAPLREAGIAVIGKPYNTGQFLNRLREALANGPTGTGGASNNVEAVGRTANAPDADSSVH